MNLLAIPYVVVAAMGAAVLSVSSYAILSGPFGGGPLVGDDVLILATIGAMAGLLALAYGGTKTARYVLGF